MRLLFILGTNPDLSKKEIEAAATILPLLWSTSSLRPGILELKSTQPLAWEAGGIAGYLSPEAANLRQTISTLQARLGGTIQIVLLWQQATLRDTPAVLATAIETIPVLATRWKLAVRSIGTTIQAERLALQIKRELKARHFTVRYLPSKTGIAGVFHEKLDLNRFDPNHPGLELVVLPEEKGLWLGVTLCVQDIDEYSRRDFGIPLPDPTSGMLPPKLAQIMINLCVGSPKEQDVVYDPFCGNGRILLEASQMGLLAFGSDLSLEKVEASRQNLQWLKNEASTAQTELVIWQDDARLLSTVEHFNSHLAAQSAVHEGRRFIISEPYLGRPLRSPLQAQEVVPWLDELSELYSAFLETWKKAEIEMMLLIFPSASVVGGSASLLEHLFDRLIQIGYAPKRLAHYSRKDTLVSRDIVQLTYAK